MEHGFTTTSQDLASAALLLAGVLALMMIHTPNTRSKAPLDVSGWRASRD